MMVKDLKALKVGDVVHVERPGPCASRAVLGVTPNGVKLNGNKYYRGLSLGLLHLPGNCPVVIVRQRPL